MHSVMRAHTAGMIRVRAILLVSIAIGVTLGFPRAAQPTSNASSDASDRTAIRLSLANPQLLEEWGEASVGQRFRFTVRIKNRGSAPATLVTPGDGSKHGWRTPKLDWLVERDGRSAGFTESPRREGNIAPLRFEEVFTVRPGKTVDISEFTPPIRLAAPGKYSVRLRYTNDPNMIWRGVPLGNHSAAAMRGVRTSTPCDLVSNAVQVEVRASNR